MSDSQGTLEELLAHSGWLRGLAQRLVGESGADDVVQEVWLRAAQSSPAQLASARGWLRAALRTIHQRRAERSAAATARERAVARPERLPSAGDLAGRAEAQRGLVEAVLSLAEPYRRTVLLRYFEVRSIAEIARDGGDPESTVRSRLARGLEQLRERLDQRPGGREAWLSGMALLATPERVVVGVSVLSLGSLVVWKALIAVVSVCLLAWFGRALLVDDIALPDASVADDGGPQLAPPQSPEPTDEAAAATFAAPPGSGARVAVEATPQVSEVAEPEATAPSTRPAISGRVVDPSGAPVVGATVYEGTLAQVALSLRNAKNPRRPSAVTGEGGGYRLAFESAGAKIVSAWSDGFSASEARAVELSSDAELAGVELQLRVGATLRGVVYGLDGAPIAGRRVQASCTDLGEFREITSDAEGAFELAALNPGTWLAATYPADEELVAAGKSTGGAAAMGFLAQAEVKLTEGGTEEVTLGLVAADSPRVTGHLTVVGQPAAGMLQWYPAARPTEKKVSMVGADGAFMIELPHPGTWIVHGNTTSKTVKSRGQRRTLELAPFASLELEFDLRGATLAGRVVDTDGTPIQGVRVELRTVGGAAHQPDPTIGGDSDSSDAEGGYAFDLLLPGTYVAVVHGARPKSDGPQYGAAVSEPVTLRGEETGRAADLVLAIGAHVEVQVVDAAGRPAAGASVYFHDAAGRPLNPSTSTGTNGQGLVDSPALPLGPVFVTAVHNTGASAPVSVEVGLEARVELALGPPLWIELATEGGALDPTSGHISITDASGRRWGGLVDIRHLWDPRPEREHPERPLFGPVPPGTYRVQVEGPDGIKRDEVTLGPESPLVSTARMR